jgi:hypothetical protein
MKALSIRQPWAWLIVNGYKDIENRNWRTKYRGPVLIHAAQKMRLEDYYQAQEIAKSLGVRKFPSVNTLMRDFSGGIVGIATITDCVDESPSPWFFGFNGFVLADARPLTFTPLKGRLSFFESGLRPVCSELVPESPYDA